MLKKPKMESRPFAAILARVSVIILGGFVSGTDVGLM